MKPLLAELRKNRVLFLMLIPAILYFVVFSYIPMAGSIVAFKRFNYNQGIFGSPWNGLENFRFFFISGQAWNVTRNTFLYNILFMVTGNVLQITIAILLVELPSKTFRKVSQTMMFLPYFISWVVAGTFVYNLFNYEFGTINTLLKSLGLKPIDVYSNPSVWKYILLFFNSWKWAGYGSVVYLAAILGIDTELYEAAQIDGAGVWCRIRRITLPLLVPTVIILVLLNIGRIFRGDFDMFFQLVGDSGNLFEATNVIDTFVFRALMRNSDFGMASAAAFYQSVLCFGTILLVNFIIRKTNKDYALF
ncbi:MAG: ABC transporter permease subunit [Treponema sp.]|nr:ABC transporter permease subunit [Treponema sp.]